MKTCLVVDDSRVIRKVARKIVEELQFECAEAGDGAAIRFANGLSARQAEIVLAGGIIGWCRQG